MGKKKVPKHRMPRLPVWDRMLYFVAGITVAFGSGAGMFAANRSADRIAFADPSVVAASGQSVHLILTPIFWGLVLGTLLIVLYDARQPLFGIRNYPYGPPKWAPRYPLFMKNRPRPPRKPWERRSRRIGTTVLLVMLLFSLAQIPLTVKQRTVLLEDGQIVRYDGRDREISRSVGIDRVTFLTEVTPSSKFNPSYHVEAVLQLADGNTEIFSAGDFRREDQNGAAVWLWEMLRL